MHARYNFFIVFLDKNYVDHADTVCHLGYMNRKNKNSNGSEEQNEQDARGRHDRE
jgi:hypothetical protein